MLRLSFRTQFVLRKRAQKDGESRGMATLKAISMRLKSVKNIQKITQSMKMVSAAKYSRAERELKQIKPLGDGAKVFYEKLEIQVPEDKQIEQKTLYLAITSDRGLCGAVHSSVAKVIRTALGDGNDNIKIICVGDKSRSALQRLYASNIILVCQEIGRIPPTFADASKLTDQILKLDFEYDSAKIVFNRFRSVVSYITEMITVYKGAVVLNAPKIKTLDEKDIDEDTLLSFVEFSIASLIFYAMKEGACSEQSSRMTAMDNASKNATEMISKLTLTFNRTRQAVITRELIEIISGASAL